MIGLDTLLTALSVRPNRKNEQRRCGNLAGMRQWIESVCDTLKYQLGPAAGPAP